MSANIHGAGEETQTGDHCKYFRPSAPPFGPVRSVPGNSPGQPIVVCLASSIQRSATEFPDRGSIVIPRELLKALRKIEITTTAWQPSSSPGLTRRLQGQGLAFREVRQYQPGDDIRSIDWNVSARMNDTYVKVFVEEREMTVMLVVDLSRANASARGAAARPSSRREVSALCSFQCHQAQRSRGLDPPTDRSKRSAAQEVRST